MATVSKDGTWKVFNTAIEYTKGQVSAQTGSTLHVSVLLWIIFSVQDASVIISAEYAEDKIDSGRPSLITISPEGKLVALCQDKRVNLYSVLTGQLVESIDEPHSQPIVKVIEHQEKRRIMTVMVLYYFRSCSLRTASISLQQETNTSGYSSMFQASKIIFLNLRKCWRGTCQTVQQKKE